MACGCLAHGSIRFAAKDAELRAATLRDAVGEALGVAQGEHRAEALLLEGALDRERAIQVLHARGLATLAQHSGTCLRARFVGREAQDEGVLNKDDVVALMRGLLGLHLGLSLGGETIIGRSESLRQAQACENIRVSRSWHPGGESAELSVTNASPVAASLGASRILTRDLVGLELARMRQLEALKKQYQQLQQDAQSLDLTQGSKAGGAKHYERASTISWITQAEAAVVDVFGPQSTYVLRWQSFLQGTGGDGFWKLTEMGRVDSLKAVFVAAHAALQGGYLLGIREGLRAETLSEVLEQAERHCAQGELVAATSLAGGALETHLHHLCERHSIQYRAPGSISAYEQAIAKARNDGVVTVYSAARSKDIIAWGGKRNTAAHQPLQFNESKQVVEIMIAGIRLFLQETALA